MTAAPTVDVAAIQTGTHWVQWTHFWGGRGFVLTLTARAVDGCCLRIGLEVCAYVPGKVACSIQVEIPTSHATLLEGLTLLGSQVILKYVIIFDQVRCLCTKVQRSCRLRGPDVFQSTIKNTAHYMAFKMDTGCQACRDSVVLCMNDEHCLLVLSPQLKFERVQNCLTCCSDSTVSQMYLVCAKAIYRDPISGNHRGV